jgi:hypothetical protein
MVGGMEMRIASSNITMASKQTYLEVNEQSERLKIWVGQQRPNFEGKQALALLLPENQPDVLELSDGVKPAQATAAKEEKDFFEPSEKDKMKIYLVERMVELLTGKKLKLSVPKVAKGKSNELQTQLPASNSFQSAQGVQPTQGQPRQGWGLEYDYHQKHYEREEMSFAATGIIKTQDGKQIDFSLQLNMSREFKEEINLSIRAGDAVKVDPLVINFNGSAAQLTDTKFSFDLDSNGQAEQLSFVQPGSGFLALDLNNDGIINNGSELFGPNSGDGFGELAKYDQDGNQWIDENDAIYNKLRIWSKDEQGQDQLIALGQQGIGAIYLGHITTSFDLKQPDNQLQGQIKSSGVYLNENGSAGTVQEIDLVV